MSSDAPAVRVEGLSKRYELYDTPRDRLKQFLLPRLQRLTGNAPRCYFREFWALKDISFEVRRGESVGIVGRNGSGKSTLLQIITGTLSATSGNVQTQGRLTALLELGSGFNPEFTGRENVYLNARLLGLGRAQVDEQFDAIASFADIGPHLDQPVKTYSSGMLVRLAFAVQIQVKPEILIVDEALAVGDALFQKRCFQQIAKLVASGTTLLFVSHDQEIVRTHTQRCLLLDRGSPAAWGPTAEVMLEYRRRLNTEETAYFTAAVQDLATRSRGNGAEMPPQAPEGVGRPSDSVDPSGALSFAAPGAAQTLATEVNPDQSANSGDSSVDRGGSSAFPARGNPGSLRSFGSGSVAVLRVEMLDGAGLPCSIFFPGAPIAIRITCRSYVDTDKLNVSIRIRNKEGVKIYSWGTLNQDMRVLAAGSAAPAFWSRHVAAGETFDVLFACACNLGANLYETQAAVSIEETPDYMAQHVLHWVDEAAFFQVLLKKDEHFFGGVVDLQMTANWRFEPAQ
jgi:lipopolysaccharide transport system ATP-binding protein